MTKNTPHRPDNDTSGLLGGVSAHFLPSPPNRLGVAVSGGGDSVALLHLLTRFCQSQGTALFAVTVDHGLRAVSADEAQSVAHLCKALNVPHTILRWTGWDHTGNLQDQARRARYLLMTEWACQNDIPVLALGHTSDDQAETVLLRLSRGAGVDGLAAMATRRVHNGVTLVRPLLDVSRAQLRAYLGHHDLKWSDDPSNDDPRFDRIKMRNALQVLAPLGITAPVLAQVAEQMGKARDALDWHSFLAARETSHVVDGDIVIDLKRFRTLPEEIARRLLVRAVMWVSGSEYPPRRNAMSDLIAAIRAGRRFTLDGSIVSRHQGNIWISREYNAVRDLAARPDETWDQRWHVQCLETDGEAPPDVDDVEVRALGQEGLAQCPDWRETGRPRVGLLASPSIWRGDDLVSAPLAGRAEGWNVALSRSGEEFFAALLSH